MKPRNLFKVWIEPAVQQRALSRRQIKLLARAVHSGQISPEVASLVDWVNLCSLPSDLARELFPVQWTPAKPRGSPRVYPLIPSLLSQFRNKLVGPLNLLLPCQTDKIRKIFHGSLVLLNTTPENLQLRLVWRKRVSRMDL